MQPSLYITLPAKSLAIHAVLETASSGYDGWDVTFINKENIRTSDSGTTFRANQVVHRKFSHYEFACLMAKISMAGNHIYQSDTIADNKIDATVQRCMHLLSEEFRPVDLYPEAHT